MAGGGELTKRLLTAVVYAAVVFAALLFSVETTVLLMCAFAGLCAFEFYSMMHKDGKLPNTVVGTLFSILYPCAAYIGGQIGLSAVTVVLLAIILVWYVFYPRVRIADISITMFGAIYTGLSLSMLVLIRTTEPNITGALLALAVFVSVWANDSFAYLFGMKFGKHKLAPKISPKKSWEGFFAGLLGSVAVWVLVAVFVDGVDFSYPWAVFVGIVCGIIGVLGDFAESRIKRGAGVKDSSNMLPGHGGFLDRCDSLIFVSIAAFFIMRFGGII